jgi:Nif-specific regulatory protein
MARRDIIAPEDVPLSLSISRPAAFPGPSLSGTEPATLPREIADIERERLIEALQRCGGVQTRAAALLGITPRQMGYRLRRYRIDPRSMFN